MAICASCDAEAVDTGCRVAGCDGTWCDDCGYGCDIEAGSDGECGAAEEES